MFGTLIAWRCKGNYLRCALEELLPDRILDLVTGM
jgi:hypothetical protein